MKALMSFVCIGLILILPSCKDGMKSVFPENPTTATTLLIDETDPGLAQAVPQEIVNLYRISDANMYNGYVLRYRRISDVHLKPTEQFQIRPEYMLFADDNERITELKMFRQRIAEIFTAVDSEIKTAKPNSVVYRTINSELNHLATEVHATTKNCIIFSDMLDHSDDYNFYSAASLQLAERNPQAVIQRFEHIAPLASLKGIHVYIVYSPRTYQEEKRFDVAVNVYKLLLTGKGAEVSIVSNIPETM
jgi:hypothetical protein